MCGGRVIANLFDSGYTFFLSPYKVFWVKILEKHAFSIRFAVSVPKRCFKRAVKRNLLKRRTREVFRTNKHILNAAITDGGQVQMTVIYASDKPLPFTDLEEAMKKILQHITQQYVEPD